MDSVVQLIRNALCVTKDLGWFRNTLLWDSTIPVKYYKLEEPFNKTTPLEVMISIAQTYVIYSGIPNSIRMIYTNYLKLQRIQRLITNESKQRTGPPTDVDRILYNALLKEANVALKSMFVGFNIFCIAGSFIWLAGNSWHITETDIIGGLPGLIHALTVMNTCLTPLLFYMYQDATTYLNTAKQMETLSEIIKKTQQPNDDQATTTENDTADTTSKSSSSKNLFDARTIELPTFELLGQTTWKPFWSNDENITAIAETVEEMNLMQQEKETIRTILSTFCNIDESSSVKKSSSSNNDKKEKSAAATTPSATSRYVLVQDTIQELETSIPIVRFQGYREFLYLVINFIAWYGYGVCILVYYYNYDETKQPSYIRRIFLHLSNNDADFYGNLAGDCMWTFEPIIALSTPYYIDYLRNRSRKKTTTTTSTTTTKAKTE